MLIANIGSIGRQISLKVKDHKMRNKRGEISTEEMESEATKTNQILSVLYTIGQEVYDINKASSNLGTQRKLFFSACLIPCLCLTCCLPT